MDGNMIFNVINEAGEEVECEALFTFESNITGKQYVIYTDHTCDEGGERVYASVYSRSGTDSELSPIENEEEWAQIELVLEQLQNDEINRGATAEGFGS